jgi:predicted dinucleotide-utilizing enzyme
MKAAVPVGKKLLTTGASVLVSGVGALNDAGKKDRERKREAADQDGES